MAARYARPGSTSAWRKLRAQVLTRDAWTCRTCGVTTHPKCSANGCGLDACAGHIVAHADGGPDTMANLVCQCRSCNLRGPAIRHQQPVSYPTPEW